MPTYEYECTDCKHGWEEDQSIKDDPVKVCPSCKNETAKRLISGSNFVLVGGGWAKEGYSTK
ncbi:MAG TPA: zinc ribbon domain-containing protein [Anaerovoracaceae bacterium]|nr:zinc ribbon domain-containing protein [Anaerovoracaceae bacterium]